MNNAYKLASSEKIKLHNKIELTVMAMSFRNNDHNYFPYAFPSSFSYAIK